MPPSRDLTPAPPVFLLKSNPVHPPASLLEIDCISDAHCSSFLSVLHLLVSFSPTWNTLLRPQPALTDSTPVSLYPGTFSDYPDPHYAFSPQEWDVCDLGLTNEYMIPFVLYCWLLLCVD